LSEEDAKPLIVFLGKAGSGKTTAAERLCYLNPEYRMVHFASRLKQAASLIWGEDVAHNNRGLLQWLGNTMREYDEDVWINAALQDIDSHFKGGRACVIDDCRFPNEYNKLQELGAYFIRTVCTEEVRVDRLQRKGKFQNIEQLSDITETALDDYGADYTIDTTPFDGFLDDITEAVADTFNRIRSV
jgi:hypothetical protein